MANPTRAKILIVDDDATTRGFMRPFFEQEEYSVKEAEDGKTALLICKDFQPDCVLLDIQMPVMNGMQILKQIKSKYPKIPVIMTTGVADLKIMRKTAELGAYTHIVKPINVDELGTVVRMALGQEDERSLEPSEDKEKQGGTLSDEPPNTKINALIEILDEIGVVSKKNIMKKIRHMK